MGNSASKDGSSGSRTLVRRAHEDHSDSTTSPITQQPSADRLTVVYGAGASSSRRSSRPDIPFLHLSRDRSEQQQPKQRETRQEREARRAERERQARLKERERSVKEESVDGGFLVTLGTYTGPEDFSKAVVRQLQIERRLAPFWKGLNDHSDSWTEHQLVAAVRGLPIPAADAIPTEVPRSSSQASAPWQAGDPTAGSLLPDSTAQLSTSNPAPSPISLSPLASSPLFRSRSKTLASLTGTKPTSSDSLPQEIRLPNDPYINGLPIEAYLYREPGECPICFLYYPPYLNKTRCCDQAICSECFVQIKRPDPHLPEHEQPGQTRSPEEEAGLLVSEVASCPFCVAPEFGITYDPPQFRRGLVYANYLAKTGKDLSATSSQSSFQSGERRRTISISASAPEVVTTDRVRPDWAKKLADARAHVLRRSAAATALHNAAYVLGSEDLFTRGYGRRRRSIFADSPGTSGNHTPRDGGDAIADLLPGRGSSRRNRVEDLEDLMMMEAIRLSLAAEEERKKKEDKEKAKDDKKKAKEAKKEQKQLEKLAKKSNGSSSSIYKLPSNDSASTWASTSMARSTSNLGSQPILEEDVSGKGKGPALQIPAASFSEPFLPAGASSTTQSDSQRHLEESRANIQPAASNPIPMPGRRHHPRQLSNASSIASSIDSPTASYRAESPLPGSTFDMLPESAEDGSLTSGTPAAGAAGGLEPLLNFQSLAAMIGKENAKSGSDHVENLLVADSPISGQGQVDDASSSHVGQDAIDEKAGLSEHQNDATVVADGDKKTNTEADTLPASNTTLSKEDRKNSTDVHVHEQKQYHEPTQ